MKVLYRIIGLSFECSTHEMLRTSQHSIKCIHTVVGGVAMGVAKLHGDIFGVGGIEADTGGKPALLVGRSPPLPNILAIGKDGAVFC